MLCFPIRPALRPPGPRAVVLRPVPGVLLAGVLLAGVLLAACAPLPTPQADPGGGFAAPAGVSAPPDPATAARNFVSVVAAVEPVAEAECRARAPGVPCDFAIYVDDRPGQPPNAFQTVDRAGNPVIVFTLALIADARNRDELAFVLGHETAHHIAGHLARTQQSAIAGAVLMGALASLSGAGTADVRAAQDIGAAVGARTYSKEFELEADSLGTVIAWRAGFDPLLGAGFFDRLPDPGDRFLGTHPPNRDRRAVVLSTLAQLR